MMPIVFDEERKTDRRGAPRIVFDDDASAVTRPKDYVSPEISNDPISQGANPAAGQSFGQNALAGAGKALTDIGRGVGQITGLLPQSSIDASAKLDAPLMKTGGGITGNILGNVAAFLPTALIPGANAIAGSAAIGGAMGALQPVETKDSRIGNTAAGAIGGGLGTIATRAIARALSPTSNPQAQLLLREGITPTPGQLLGGVAQRLEDKLSSLPGFGDAIIDAKRRGLNEFQQAAYSRALAPIGESHSGALGRDGVAEVRTALQGAYNNLTPRLSFRADPQFTSELGNLRGMAATLPNEQARRFNQILAEQIDGKMTNAGLMNGARVKEVEGELSRLASGYRRDPSFDNRQLGDALTQARQLIRDNLQRMNPQIADELQGINAGWANYAKLRDASSRVGAINGEFTPAQLASAVRSGDATLGKRGYSEGTALLQDLTDAGKNVLGAKYPDSGTTGRALVAMALNPLAWPKLGAGVAAAGVGSLPYLPGGRQVTAALLARRPDAVRQIAEMLRETSPQLGMAASAGMVRQD